MPLARQVVEPLRSEAEEHTLEVVATEQAILVEGDAVRLEQMLHNLLDNAIKYSPDGGRISLIIEANETEAILQIVDEGIGIPADALPNLFSSFYRAENVNPLRITGLGLGLYIVKKSTALHGVSIEVASEENRGSTFTIRLPRLCTSPPSIKR